MRTPFVLLLLVLLTGLFPGCTSAGSDAEATSPSTDVPVATPVAPSSSPDANPPVSPGGAEVAPPPVEIFTFNGSYAVGIAETTEELEITSHPIEVREGAQRVRIELSWTGTGDMDAVLESPAACYEPDQECAIDEGATRGTGDGRFQNAGGNAAMPDAPSILEIERADIEANSECRRPSRCGWYVQAYPTAGTDFAWTLVATVFYDAAMS